MKKKKLILTILTALSIILNQVTVLAQPLSGFEPGIENIQGYQEIVFLTGTPILMKGTVKASIKEKTGIRTEKYTYKLANQTGDSTLTRSLSITSTLSDDFYAE